MCSMHFISWVGVEINAFFMVRYTIFFAMPFFLHEVFIPALPLECVISNDPVVLSSFLALRGKYIKYSCVCPMHFYLMDGCRNEYASYGEIHHFSFFIIYSLSKMSFIALSAVARAHFFFIIIIIIVAQ